MCAPYLCVSEKHGKYGNVAEFSGNISEHTNKHTNKQRGHPSSDTSILMMFPQHRKKCNGHVY